MARSKNVRPRRGPRRQTRAEKSKEFRQVLIDSAAQTVSRHGYADASVSRITQRAKLAQGTFYNYFETRQDILDLLPVAYGEKMLGYIGEQTANADRGADRETMRLEAFFMFFEQNRSGARLINEAPTLAPKGYEAYYDAVKNSYIRSLKRSLTKGDLVGFDEGELEFLVDILIAVRTGLAQRYLSPGSRAKENRTAVLKTYRKLIARALFTQPSGRNPGAK